MTGAEDNAATSHDDYSIVDEFDVGKTWKTNFNGTPQAEEDLVCSVAEALEPDDEIIINGRSRSLAVLGYEKQSNPGLLKSTFYPAHILWLRGNGAEYRLRWSHDGQTYPKLHTESELETRESFHSRLLRTRIALKLV